MSAPDRPLKAERSRRALGRVGRAVQAAVERFVLVGETIADDNPEIKLDMYEACREARQAGTLPDTPCLPVCARREIARRNISILVHYSRRPPMRIDSTTRAIEKKPRSKVNFISPSREIALAALFSRRLISRPPLRAAIE